MLICSEEESWGFPEAQEVMDQGNAKEQGKRQSLVRSLEVVELVSSNGRDSLSGGRGRTGRGPGIVTLSLV